MVEDNEKNLFRHLGQNFIYPVKRTSTFYVAPLEGGVVLDWLGNNGPENGGSPRHRSTLTFQLRVRVLFKMTRRVVV